MQSKGEILIYKAKDGSQQLEVKLDEDTVWLSQAQMVGLFNSSKQNISHHIRQIYKEGELRKGVTVKKYLTVQKEAKRMVSRYVEVYNLDVIISVGYRVKSKRGTQFRQWATQQLKDHLIRGYTLNEKRLQLINQNMQQLEQAVKLIQQSGNSEQLNATEAKGLLEIITNYTQSFILLNQFDSNNLPDKKLNEDITYEIEYKEAKEAISELKKQLIKKKEASNLFGNERDQGFESILNSVVQTFGGEYLYKSIEEQAAHLLYFVIKNHPFTDGNKRIGAFLFVWFLEKNKHRFKKSGELKINDNALVALALLVAQSNPDDKEVMIKLVINLIRS
ncbi:MAG: virulence protein RhuM/Fic/DOC family protein [Chitinophagaceae bacterium]|nr:virulence protein RhuM/Fic/DOC family protein [Chitinophagaceae bacterium]MCB9054985.1 virulence protein RhuM/Fic/DOC family protein [Chitinophagales bacterium]